MNLMAKKLAVWTLAAVALLAASQSYASVTYETPAGSSMGGDAVGGEATFSLVGDVLTIQLSSLVANPISDGSLLSGLEFDVAGGTTASLTASSGKTTTINSGGSYTPSSTAQSLSKWKLASSSGSMINLSTFGNGSPYDMIIGPDSKGGFSGAGKYSNANSSIYNHQPEVLGTATFTITVNGLSSLSQISDVQFEFGTSSGCWVCGNKVNTPNPVPEPTTIISGLLMLVPLSIQLVRKVRGQKLAPVKVSEN
jgi:hypothetical protein